MRLLAALLAGSGVAWLIALVLMVPGLLVPSLSPVVVVAASYVAVAAGVALTARGVSDLPGRLLALWGLAVAAVGVTVAPAGEGWYQVGAAVLFGTIAFVLWAAPPLLVFSWVWSFRRTPAPPARSEPREPGTRTQ